MFSAAIKLCLIEGRTVTLQSFCARTGFLANHHTRRFLDAMVAHGYCVSFMIRFSDGFKRRVYCAERSRDAFERNYSSSEIDHHLLMPMAFLYNEKGVR